MEVQDTDRQSAHAIDWDGAGQKRGHEGREVGLVHLQPRPSLQTRPGVEPVPCPDTLLQPPDARAPEQERRDGLLVHARAVRAPVSHPVIRGQDVGGPPVLAEVLLHHADHPPDPLVHRVDIVPILLAVGLMDVAIGVTAEEVQEEHVALLAELQLERCVLKG